MTASLPVAFSVADELARAGGRVVVLSSGDSDAGSRDAPLAFLPCRFESEEEVARAVAEAEGLLGGIDQFVHAWVADGLVEPMSFADIDERTWTSRCEATLEGAWWLTRQTIGPLRRAGGGSIVFMVPTVGMSGAAEFTMLATVSEGIRVLARGCARHWGKDRVTVHTVVTAPDHWVPPGWGEPLAASISLAVPAMGGPGDVGHDLAPIAALLGAPELHFWTAGTLVADGGVWMGL